MNTKVRVSGVQDDCSIQVVPVGLSGKGIQSGASSLGSEGSTGGFIELLTGPRLVPSWYLGLCPLWNGVDSISQVEVDVKGPDSDGLEEVVTRDVAVSNSVEGDDIDNFGGQHVLGDTHKGAKGVPILMDIEEAISMDVVGGIAEFSWGQIIEVVDELPPQVEVDIIAAGPRVWEDGPAHWLREEGGLVDRTGAHHQSAGSCELNAGDSQDQERDFHQQQNLYVCYGVGTLTQNSRSTHSERTLQSINKKLKSCVSVLASTSGSLIGDYLFCLSRTPRTTQSYLPQDHFPHTPSRAITSLIQVVLTLTVVMLYLRAIYQ